MVEKVLPGNIERSLIVASVVQGTVLSNVLKEIYTKEIRNEISKKTKVRK